MFSRAQWIHLFNAQLVGFPGFVFGILILSAIPIYVATTSIIIRTKTPLFSIPFSGTLKKMFSGPVADPAPTSPPLPESETSNCPTTPDTRNIPGELKDAFERTKQNIQLAPLSVFNNTDIPTGKHTTPSVIPVYASPVTASVPVASDFPPQPQPPVIETPAGELPIPSDFDFDSDDLEPNIFDNDFQPIFSDINFDTPDNPSTTKPKHPDSDTDIVKYLTGHNHKIISQENDIIITNRIALAVHNSPEFWVTDSDYWFAPGIQKPSPTRAILTAASKHNIQPVLYLRESNIMDLDTCQDTWRKSGITIINNLTELPN